MKAGDDSQRSGVFVTFTRPEPSAAQTKMSLSPSSMASKASFAAPGAQAGDRAACSPSLALTDAPVAGSATMTLASREGE